MNMKGVSKVLSLCARLLAFYTCTCFQIAVQQMIAHAMHFNYSRYNSAKAK